MKQIERILVALERLESEQPALERAVMLATHTGASIELYCADYNEGLSGHGRVDATVLKDLRDAHTKEVLAWLADLGHGLAARGIEVTTQAQYGHPEHAEIVRRANEIKPDLIVKATRSHPVLERNYFRASDWHLIKHCSHPLLFVKQPELDVTAPVIAAIDPFQFHERPSDLDAQILETGAFLAGALDTSLHVVHVVTPVSSFVTAEESHFDHLANEARAIEEHRARVLDLSRRYGVSSERIHIVGGSARHEIPKLDAALDAGITVLGAVSRSSLGELFVGNTAEHVLEAVNSDVLVLHPQERIGRTH